MHQEAMHIRVFRTSMEPEKSKRRSVKLAFHVNSYHVYGHEQGYATGTYSADRDPWKR